MATHEDCVPRRRPGGPLFRDQHEAARLPRHDITVFERNRPDDTFGWGVVFSEETFDNIAANDLAQRGRDPLPLRLLGRHRRSLSRSEDRIERPWLFRHRAQATAHAAAAACARTECRSCVSRPRSRAPATLAKTYDLVVAADGLNSRTRAEFARAFQARHRHAQEQVRLARHASEIRRCLHVHLRRNRTRLDLGPRLPVRCRHRDVHRRVLGRDVAEIRLRRDEPG